MTDSAGDVGGLSDSKLWKTGEGIALGEYGDVDTTPGPLATATGWVPPPPFRSSGVARTDARGVASVKRTTCVERSSPGVASTRATGSAGTSGTRPLRRSPGAP